MITLLTEDEYHAALARIVAEIARALQARGLKSASGTLNTNGESNG